MRYLKQYVFVFLLLFACCYPSRADIPKKRFIVRKEVISETEIRLVSIRNNWDDIINIYVDGYFRQSLKPTYTWVCKEEVVCKQDLIGRSRNDDLVYLWQTGDTAAEWQKNHPAVTISAKHKSQEAAVDSAEEIPVKESADEPPLFEESPQPVKPEPPETPETTNNNTSEQQVAPRPAQSKPVIKPAVIEKDFLRFLERDPYYSEKAISECQQRLEDYCRSLEGAMDEEEFNIIVESNSLQDTLDVHQKILTWLDSEKSGYVSSFLSRYDQYVIQKKARCEENLERILDNKIERRRGTVNQLSNALRVDNPEVKTGLWMDEAHLLIYCLIVLSVLILVLIVILLRKQKTTRKQASVHKSPQNRSLVQPNPESAIVVRRKTMSILKKQSLEDVQNNSAYLVVDCSDFCGESAVRRMYVKDTCIKEIYHMYAEDLRNPENPKEDGCMVLGRWVEDTETHEYYVSLEEVVLPGDDAVFHEYELNFGGKIKLRVAEKLRKLRKDTDLQYDLTCWIHSHPGLGVFFSNSDHGVHLQLKHPTHPKFLTAIVVDILTPKMDMGIFTFKKSDMQVNSRQELSKMYSLEEWYRWALESEKKSYRAEEYYNVLSSASMRHAECSEVRMNNGSIIDMCQLLENAQAGFVYHCCGFSVNNEGAISHVVEKVTATNDVKGSLVNGSLLVGTHFSIPSITRQMASQPADLHFVLYYSIVNQSITCIPIVEGNLIRESAYYSIQQLEDLKIWTRRRR